MNCPLSRSRESGHSVSPKFVTSTQNAHSRMPVAPLRLLFGRKPEVLLIALSSENRKNRLNTSSCCRQSFVFRYVASTRSSDNTESCSNPGISRAHVGVFKSSQLSNGRLDPSTTDGEQIILQFER